MHENASTIENLCELRTHNRYIGIRAIPCGCFDWCFFVRNSTKHGHSQRNAMWIQRLDAMHMRNYQKKTENRKCLQVIQVRVHLHTAENTYWMDWKHTVHSIHVCECRWARACVCVCVVHHWRQNSTIDMCPAGKYFRQNTTCSLAFVSLRSCLLRPYCIAIPWILELWNKYNGTQHQRNDIDGGASEICKTYFPYNMRLNKALILHSRMFWLSTIGYFVW